MSGPIFSTAFLDEHLPAFQVASVVGLKRKKAIIQNWIDSFESNKIDYFKEEEVKSRFIMEFFGDVLGFNYKNPGIWLCREEVKAQSGATKPDAALGVFRTTRRGIINEVHVVIEMKGPDEKLDKKQSRPGFHLTPVDQGFLYAGKMGGKCRWVVVSNIEEIRFYHHSEQDCYQSFYLRELGGEQKLKELLYLFQKDHWTNSQSSVTDKLYLLGNRILSPKASSGHILDQMYLALEKFEGLEFIDPSYVANLRPFNITDDYVWHYSGNTLYTLNSAIHDLLLEVRFSGEELSVSGKLIKELHKAKVADHLKKLRYVFNRLYQFLVTEIHAIGPVDPARLTGSGDLSGKFPYVHYLMDLPHLKFSIRSQDPEVCDCINCNYRSLNFKQLIRKVKAAKTNGELMPKELAYGHYLLSTDNYRECYYIYRDAESAYKGVERKNIEYFLTKINLSHLHNLLADNTNDSKEILSAIKSIDLDRSIHNELDVYVDEDVRKYLIKIKDFELFNKIEKKIAGIVTELEDVKRVLDDGGDCSGPDHVGNLAHQYHLLYSHFHKNYLVYDAFSAFRKTVTNVIRGLLISYQTKDRGIKFFPEFYLIEAILYSSRGDLMRLLKDVPLIKVAEESKTVLVTKAINFLTSFYDEMDFGGFANNEMAAQLLNWGFQEKYENSFSNLFTVLSRLELNDEQAQQLVKPICNFVQLEHLMSGHELSELGSYLEKYGHVFKRHQVIELLSFAVGKMRRGYIKYNSLIKSLCVLYPKVSPGKPLSEKSIISRAVENVKDDHGYFSIRDVVGFFNILDDDNKAFLKKEILDYMEAHFESHWYQELLFSKVINWKDRGLFKKLVAEVNGWKAGSDPIFLENGKYDLKNPTMANFISIYYVCGVPGKSSALAGFTGLSTFAQWALFPARFDYAGFDVRWLKVVDYEHILKGMSRVKMIGPLLKGYLSGAFDPELSQIYFKYFAKS